MSERLKRLRRLTDEWSEAAQQAGTEASAEARRKGDKFMKKKYRKGKVGGGGSVKSIAGPLGYASTGSYEGFGGYSDAVSEDGRRS